MGALVKYKVLGVVMFLTFSMPALSARVRTAAPLKTVNSSQPSQRARVASRSQERTCRPSEARNCWRGLVPMYSTRADVERLLGAPNAGGQYKFYLFEKQEAVRFTFAKGDCKSDHGWKLPKDTIFTISVTPHREILLNDLGLNLATYERVESTHPENMFYYTNLADGLTIRTTLLAGVETVDNIEYGPTTKDIGLACQPLK